MAKDYLREVALEHLNDLNKQLSEFPGNRVGDYNIAKAITIAALAILALKEEKE